MTKEKKKSLNKFYHKCKNNQITKRHTVLCKLLVKHYDIFEPFISTFEIRM